jgi:CheY-like chemotaxis protein
MKIRVLLAEDENAWLFVNILGQYNGFEFIRHNDNDFVSRGDQAVELAREARPDIILMDLRMPVMDGLEAIRKIREFDPDVPIIAFSAYTDKQTRGNALAAGANAFFVKPPNYQKLYLMITSLIAARPRRGEMNEADLKIRLDKQNRLNKLLERQARMGDDTPIHIITEIETLRAELER